MNTGHTEGRTDQRNGVNLDSGVNFVNIDTRLVLCEIVAHLGARSYLFRRKEKATTDRPSISAELGSGTELTDSMPLNHC